MTLTEPRDRHNLEIIDLAFGNDEGTDSPPSSAAAGFEGWNAPLGVSAGREPREFPIPVDIARIACAANARSRERLGFAGCPMIPKMAPLRNFGRFEAWLPP